MTNKHMKKCSISLTTKEIQIKTMLRFQLESLASRTQNSPEKCWRECGEKGTLIHYWW
jgi:hypothetical protein